MIDWYTLFILAVLFLWAFSASQDRAALRIVLLASLFSEVLVDAVTVHIHGAWKLAIPGAVEILTIAALLQWGRNRTAYIQAGLLVGAWLAHLICYVDCQTGSNIVYDHYEQIIAGFAIGQLLGFHETAFSIGRNIQKWFNLWADGESVFSGSGRSSAMVRGEDVPSQTKAS